MSFNAGFAITYLLTDAMWLSLMTRDFYRPRFERIQQRPMEFNTRYAVLAYLILLFIMFFICIPLVRVYPPLHPSLVFAMVGMAVYGVYNMTNAAVLSDYDVVLCVVDMMWGVLSFAFMGWVYHKYGPHIPK